MSHSSTCCAHRAYEPDTAKPGEGVVDIRIVVGEMENSSFESEQWRRMRRGKRRYVKLPVDIRGNMRFAARDNMSVHVWYLPGTRDDAPLSEIKVVRLAHLYVHRFCRGVAASEVVSLGVVTLGVHFACRYSDKHAALLQALRDVGYARLYRANLPVCDLWPLPNEIESPVEFALVAAVATDAMPPLAGIALSTRSAPRSATAAPAPSEAELFRRSYLPLPEDMGSLANVLAAALWCHLPPTLTLATSCGQCQEFSDSMAAYGFGPSGAKRFKTRMPTASGCPLFCVASRTYGEP